MLAVGDPRRPAAGRAVVATLLSAAVFLAFAWMSKEIRGLSGHAPWQNDPYDAVVSFTLFFVPLTAGLLLIRALLCRRDEPLPVARFVGVGRASRVVVVAVSATLAADWLSVFLRADRATWDATTMVLIVALGLATLVAAPAAFLAYRVAAATPPGLGATAGPDVLADTLTLGRRWSLRLGPLARPADVVLGWLETDGAPVVRRHPLAAAAACSIAFGATLCLAEARAEGVAPVLGLVFAIATCGMFAFLGTSGSYLGVVRAERPLVGTRRRFADACVLAAAAGPIALAFRGSLWWIVGATDASAGLGELAVLVLVVTLGTFAIVLLVETVAGTHDGPGRSTAR